MQAADSEWLVVVPQKDSEQNFPVPYESRARENVQEVPERKRDRELLWKIIETVECVPNLRERLARQVQKAMFALEEFVEVQAAKCGGVPVLRGTRFTVSQLLAQFADGDSLADLVENLDLDEIQISGLLHAMAVILDRPPAK